MNCCPSWILAKAFPLSVAAAKPPTPGSSAPGMAEDDHGQLGEGNDAETAGHGRNTGRRVRTGSHSTAPGYSEASGAAARRGEAVSNLPLSDLRVVEPGQLLAGPFCGQLLGDFGAEVIKVEDPGRGDPMREWGREKPHGKSLWWPVLTRIKMLVTCELRAPAG